jgi:hypothetical protein
MQVRTSGDAEFRESNHWSGVAIIKRWLHGCMLGMGCPQGKLGVQLVHFVFFPFFLFFSSFRFLPFSFFLFLYILLENETFNFIERESCTEQLNSSMRKASFS